MSGRVNCNAALVQDGEEQPLVLIGYWRGQDDDGWPDVRDFVDLNQDAGERGLVGTYLTSGTVTAVSMGGSPCRICGTRTGSTELSDGIYVWPEGLAHYVLDHAVRLPSVFVSHALRRVRMFDIGNRDEDWWRSLS